MPISNLHSLSIPGTRVTSAERVSCRVEASDRIEDGELNANLTSHWTRYVPHADTREQKRILRRRRLEPWERGRAPPRQLDHGLPTSLAACPRSSFLVSSSGDKPEFDARQGHRIQASSAQHGCHATCSPQGRRESYGHSARVTLRSFLFAGTLAQLVPFRTSQQFPHCSDIRRPH